MLFHATRNIRAQERYIYNSLSPRTRTQSPVHKPFRLYLQFAYVKAYIDRVHEDVRGTRTGVRARARVYVFMCARVPAYFGILIARGRPSPLSFPLRSSTSSHSSPHLVPYRAPAPRPHPQGYPSSSSSLSSPRVPLETLPIPKTFETLYATSSHTYLHMYQPASSTTIIYIA